MKLITVFIASVVVFLLSLALVEAGSLIQFTEESPEGKSLSKIYVDKFALRTESLGPNPREVMIFRRDKNVLWSINTREKTFTEMTPKAMEQAGKKMKQSMDSVRQQLREKMKNLTPEQRKMMEGMMQGRLSQMVQPKGAPPKVIAKKTASSVKVKRWQADKYELYIGAKKNEEIWITNPGALGLGPEEAKTVRAFFSFMRKVATKMGVSSGSMGGMNLPGVPIKTISYKGGRPNRKSEISKSSRQNFAASLFEIPAGLRKVDLMSGR